MVTSAKRVNILSKFMLSMLQNLYLNLLWATFASNWTKANYKRCSSGFLQQSRIQRFWKGRALYVGSHGWPTKKVLRFRWSKTTTITLETISFWRNISIIIFKFSPFLYAMKACQWNLILVMNITQTNFLYWQNVLPWCLIKVNYKRSL